MRSTRVVVVDDSAEMGETLARYLAGHAFDVDTCQHGGDAVARVAQGGVDAVLTDLRMPGTDGMDVLAGVKAADPGVPVIIMTAFGAVDSAVEAMQRGAFHYITKPFKLEVVRLLLERAVAERRLAAENQTLRAQLEEHTGLGGMVGRSSAMKTLYALVQRVAQVQLPVLILGETGAGKELVARAIHSAGPRNGRSFVAVNCAALPDQLLESELFGHARGAFTGAGHPRAGLMAEADGGTLLLDEIGEMPLALQPKLLRALETGEVRPVGADGVRHVDVRLLAATHRDLIQLVRDGRFREDLYYRLKVVPLKIPPLRERAEDIPELVKHFLGRIAARSGAPALQLAPDAVDVLLRHPWPGNVRELSHLLERLTVTTMDSRVDAAAVHAALDRPDLRDVLARARATLPTLAQLEEDYTRFVLEHAGGNRTRASEILGIDPSTLYRRTRGKTP